MKTNEQKMKAFDKLFKCVSTAKTIEHLESCTRMNDNYKKLFEKDQKDVKFYAEVIHEEIIEMKKKLKV